jgi:OmpA-OmpF porin, OOP family
MGTITSKHCHRGLQWSLWLAALAASALLPAQAQNSDVLTGAQVTEDNLLEALSPDGVQKRSLRVKAIGAGGAMSRPARPSASLLITFHTSSSMLTAGARQQLDTVGAALKNARLASYKFTVEGHADPRGNSASNLVLSQQRAASVRSYLVDSHGIDPARLVAEGRGDRELLNPEQPAAPENRRVTIVTQVQ